MARRRMKDRRKKKLIAMGIDFSEVKYEDVKRNDMRKMFNAIKKNFHTHVGLVSTMGFKSYYRHLT